MLRMTKLSKVYRTHMIETHALRDFEIQVNKGEFVTVTGPSGSGKTSFLNIAGLLEEFTDGEYILDGVNVKGMDDNARSRLRNEKLGFIFQGFNLIPDLSLFEFSSTTDDISAIGDVMDDRGWKLDRQQGGLHLMVSPGHAAVDDRFLADLAHAVEHHGESRGTDAVYGGIA